MATEEDGFEEVVRQVAALADPVRARLYRFVVGQSDPVSREEAATAVGVPLHTAKFHLDKLVDEGLLVCGFRRLTNRSGPGAGRPAKLYRRSDRAVSITLPERHYELAGALLASAVSVSEQEGTPVGETLHRTARDTGREMGRQVATQGRGARSRTARAAVVSAALVQCGYEPTFDGTSIVLRNCPFHNLARQYTDVVCGMNLDLLLGLLEGMETPEVTPRLDPSAERCCVRVEVE